jgi:hypothetical protein
MTDHEVFFDFGGGDGRVIERFQDMCFAAGGMELDEVFCDKFNKRWASISSFVYLDKGDFLYDRIPNGMTVAFASLGENETFDALINKLLNECPKLRLLITNIKPAPDVAHRFELIKTIEPPELDYINVRFLGTLESAQDHTLAELIADTKRVTVEIASDVKAEADFTFYVYNKVLLEETRAV